jgi:hypothetical protein
MSTMKEKLLEFWQNYETKVVILVGLILVALIAFQGGYLKGKSQKESPLVIEKTASCSVSSEDQSNQPKTEATVNTQPNNSSGTAENKNCAFVGSKNSNKYHLPTCRYAKSIKPENLACFSSVEDAVKRGYQPDTNCLK